MNDYSVIDGIKIADLELRPHHVLVRWLKKTESKGGILYPQDRQRKNYMIGQVLKVGPECVKELEVGQMIQFNSMCDKEFFGPQDPADRDTVFCMVDDEAQGIIVEVEGKKRFKPLHEFVMLEPIIKETEKSGLVIANPEDHEKGSPMEARRGRILEFGPRVMKDAKYRDMGLAALDVVAYQGNLSQEFTMNDDRYVLVRADQILGVLEGV